MRSSPMAAAARSLPRDPPLRARPAPAPHGPICWWRAPTRPRSSPPAVRGAPKGRSFLWGCSTVAGAPCDSARGATGHDVRLRAPGRTPRRNHQTHQTAGATHRRSRDRGRRMIARTIEGCSPIGQTRTPTARGRETSGPWSADTGSQAAGPRSVCVSVHHCVDHVDELLFLWRRATAPDVPDRFDRCATATAEQRQEVHSCRPAQNQHHQQAANSQASRTHSHAAERPRRSSMLPRSPGVHLIGALLLNTMTARSGTAANRLIYWRNYQPAGAVTPGCGAICPVGSAGRTTGSAWYARREWRSRRPRPEGDRCATRNEADARRQEHLRDQRMYSGLRVSPVPWRPPV